MAFLIYLADQMVDSQLTMKRLFARFSTWCNANIGFLTFLAILVPVIIWIIPSNKINFGAANSFFDQLITVLSYRLKIPIFILVLTVVLVIFYIFARANKPVIREIVTLAAAVSTNSTKYGIRIDYPKEGATVATPINLIQYYNSVVDYILPHISERPQSLHVKYKGPSAPGEYIKDMEGRQPESAELFSVER